MFTADEYTIVELINKSGNQRDLLSAIDNFIVSTAPNLSRKLFKGPSITMIGRGSIMAVHFARMGALTILIIGCMFLPFLPGNYDDLAVTLSFMSQLVGIAGLLLVPIRALWLIDEARMWAGNSRKQSTKSKGYHFAIASLGTSSIVAVVVSLPAFGNIGLSLGIGTLALWTYFVLRILPKLKDS